MSIKNFWGFFLVSIELVANPTPVHLDLFSVGNFTGTSSASGTSIIVSNSSTLNFQDQSTAGDASINIDASSILNFQQTGVSIYSGFLTGDGTINKVGLGDLTMTANNTPFTGPLSVQAGTLFLNGSYGGNVFVSPGAAIVYGGGIAGNLIVDASVITTNGINTLDVGGNYIQTNSGIYLVKVNSAGQSTLLNINGTANIDGFIEVDTSQGVLFRHKYTILQANGGVTGTYRFLGPNPFGFTITYDAMHVYLSTILDYEIFAQTPNQKKVASQIDTILTPNSSESALILALNALDPAQTRDAFDQMSGEQYSNFILTTLYSESRFNNKIYNSYRDLINTCISPCPGLDTWISGGWGRGFQGGNQATPGFNLINYDVSGGIHSCLNEQWLLGGALSYEVDFIHSKLPGSPTLRTGLLALYSAFQTKHVYVLTDVIGGRSWSQYKRPIAFSTLHRTAKSSPKVSHGRFDLEIGTTVGDCNFRLQPFIAASAEGYHQNKIQEHGAGSIDLTIRPITKWWASTQTGFHFNITYFQQTSIDLDVAWQHYYGNLRVSQNTQFQDFGSSFLIAGPKRGHDGGVGALYINRSIRKSWSIYAEATGEIWKNWHAYEFNGGVSYTW